MLCTNEHSGLVRFHVLFWVIVFYKTFKEPLFVPRFVLGSMAHSKRTDKESRKQENDYSG